MAVGGGAVRVGGPPEVDPVVVQLKNGRGVFLVWVRVRNAIFVFYLVVCDEDHAGCEIAS